MQIIYCFYSIFVYAFSERIDMKKIICLLMGLLLFGCKEHKSTLHLIHTNDLHSHLLPFNDFGDCDANSKECLGGFARIINFMKKEQTAHPDTLFLDAGDRFTGTSFYALTKSRYLLPLFNMMPYDAATLGNHEFDDNLAETIAFISKWNAETTVSNLKISPSEPLSHLVHPSLIVEKNNAKIGIIGVITPESNILENAPISVLPIKKSVTTEIEKLQKENIKIIVVVSHIGLSADIKLAKALPEIDIIVGGHSHSLLTNDAQNQTRRGTYPMTVNKGKTLIVSCGMGGQYVGKLQAEFDADGHIIGYNGDCMKMTYQIGNDIKAAEIISEAQNEIQDITHNQIAVLPQSYGYTQNTNYCSEECPVGEYLSHLLIQEYPEVDGVFINSGAIRTALSAGPVLYSNLLEVFPYDSPAVLMKMNGAELKKFIRHGILHYHKRSKTNELLQTSGICYKFTPDTKHISDIFIKGKPLDEKKIYTILSPLFLAVGGDNFPIKPYTETGQTMREILVKQLQKQQNIPYSLQKNVQISK